MLNNIVQEQINHIKTKDFKYILMRYVDRYYLLHEIHNSVAENCYTYKSGSFNDMSISYDIGVISEEEHEIIFFYFVDSEEEAISKIEMEQLLK